MVNIGQVDLARKRSDHESTKPTYSTARRTLAGAAIFLSVGAGGMWHQAGQEASGVAADRVVSERDNQQAATGVTRDRVTEQPHATDVRRSEMRQASASIHNNEVVQTVVEKVNYETQGEMVSQGGSSREQMMVTQRISTGIYDRQESKAPCHEGGPTRSDAEVSAELYPGGKGLVSIRLGESACRGDVYVPSRSVTMSLELTHQGRDTFSLTQAMQEISDDPASVRVASLQVRNHEQQAYMSNAQLGTGQASENFYVRNAKGDLVEPESPQEARSYAAEANTLALDTVRQLP